MPFTNTCEVSSTAGISWNPGAWILRTKLTCLCLNWSPNTFARYISTATKTSAMPSAKPHSLRHLTTHPGGALPRLKMVDSTYYLQTPPNDSTCLTFSNTCKYQKFCTYRSRAGRYMRLGQSFPGFLPIMSGWRSCALGQGRSGLARDLATRFWSIRISVARVLRARLA